jgi:hypothetical protein
MRGPPWNPKQPGGHRPNLSGAELRARIPRAGGMGAKSSVEPARQTAGRLFARTREMEGGGVGQPK